MSQNVRTPKQTRSIRKKEAITAAAMTLFSEKGYYSINSKDIAKEAGVSIGTFYAYFSDKKEVFIELLNHYKTAIGRNILVGIKSGQPLPQLIDGLIRGIVEIIHTYPRGFYNQILVLSKTDDEIKAQYDAHLIKIQDEITTFLKKMAIPIVVPDKMPVLAEFIVRMNEALVMIVVNEDNKEKQDAFIALYSDMILSLID